jgi:TolB protein
MTTIARVVLSLAMVLAVVRPVPAVVTGSIFGPGSESFPIAVVPLKSLSGDAGLGLGKEFARVLSRDLDLSGYFKLVDPKTFVENPQTSGITAEEVDFVGWASIGAQEVVKGTITVNGDQISVEIRLLDVAGRKEVPQVGRRYNGNRGDLARMAHKTADGLLEFLTGERGPFDSKIALTSTRGGPLKEVAVYTFDMDAPQTVTNERSIVVDPSWRPDLRAILFTSYKLHQPQLFQVELGSKRVAPMLNERGSFLGGAWSPDGSKLLVTRESSGNSDIYLFDRSGALIRRLTDHWAIDVSPAWAPDGRRFAFCSARSGAPQIYVASIDGGEARRVSRVGTYNTSPAWSPKGDLIAYSTRAGSGFQIVVQAIDGSGKTITSAGSNEDPSWAPDGRYLVFSSSRGGKRKLWLADRDGRTQKELTRGAGDDTSPAWSPRME